MAPEPLTAPSCRCTRIAGPLELRSAPDVSGGIGACPRGRRQFTSPEDVLTIPLFAALVFWLALGRGRVEQGPLPPLRRAGRLSNSIYSNHFLVALILSLVAYYAWWLHLGLVLAGSWATYHGIEAPARRAINRSLGSKL